jgi:hypothetical protein
MILLAWWAHYSPTSQAGEQKMLAAGISTARSKMDAKAGAPAKPAPRRKISLGEPRKVSLNATTVNRSAAAPPEITVAKSGGGFSYDRKAPKKSWSFLTKSVRSQIDSARLSQRRWKVIVIHSSATAEGSAKAFDYYHRVVKGMEHGLAYHFVIGNGHGTSNGRIEVGPRWRLQQAGGHLRDDDQNEIAIGICLVGDYQNNKPTNSQIEALDELIDYLQAKTGKIPVTTHRRINVRPTLCPGRRFPDALFVEGSVR